MEDFRGDLLLEKRGEEYGEGVLAESVEGHREEVEGVEDATTVFCVETEVFGGGKENGETVPFGSSLGNRRGEDSGLSLDIIEVDGTINEDQEVAWIGEGRAFREKDSGGSEIVEGKDVFGILREVNANRCGGVLLKVVENREMIGIGEENLNSKENGGNGRGKYGFVFKTVKESGMSSKVCLWVFWPVSQFQRERDPSEDNATIDWPSYDHLKSEME